MIIDMKIENKNCKIDIEDTVLNGLATQIIENMNEQIVKIDWEYYEDELEDTVKQYISDEKTIAKNIEQSGQDVETALTDFIKEHNDYFICLIAEDKSSRIMYDLIDNIMDVVNFSKEKEKLYEVRENLFGMLWNTKDIWNRVFNKVKIDYNVKHVINELQRQGIDVHKRMVKLINDEIFENSIQSMESLDGKELVKNIRNDFYHNKDKYTISMDWKFEFANDNIDTSYALTLLKDAVNMDEDFTEALEDVIIDYYAESYTEFKTDYAYHNLLVNKKDFLKLCDNDREEIYELFRTILEIEFNTVDFVNETNRRINLMMI